MVCMAFMARNDGEMAVTVTEQAGKIFLLIFAILHSTCDYFASKIAIMVQTDKLWVLLY